MIPGLIEDKMAAGHWVLVRNIHTHLDMVRMMERQCAMLQRAGPHRDFRLFITSLPQGLSKHVYRQSMRLVWEAPSTLRANLIRSYTTDPVNDKDFFYTTKNALVYKKSLFALCFLHAAVRERALYGPWGWTRNYGIDDFDLKFCMVQVRVFPWYLAVCMYCP
jgi:dynein heavy chain